MLLGVAFEDRADSHIGQESRGREAVELFWLFGKYSSTAYYEHLTIIV